MVGFLGRPLLDSVDAGGPSRSTPENDAEHAAAYLVERAAQALGRRADQGARREPLGGPPSPALSLLATRRLCRVPERAVRALFRWSGGFSVELRRDVPAAAHVLALQARGARCASLLPVSVEHGPRDGFEFLIHDLCHLDKFASEEHHTEQVGYFSALAGLAGAPAWRAAELDLDAAWRADRDRLASDMNGSSVYLLSVLKMRLKMAARRRLARDRGRAAPECGPLGPDEEALFAELEGALYTALGLEGAAFDAARSISARRDAAVPGAVLQAHFEAAGRAVLDAAR